MPVLINPVLGTTTVLEPVEAGTRAKLDIGQEQAIRMFTRRGVPLAVSLPLLSHFGWPEDLLGVGSFAAVFADPRNSKRVIKFSNDEVDGTTSSYIQMAQDGKVGVAKNYRELVSQCLPRIYEVGLIEFKQASGEKDALWVINIERVMPLRNDDREESPRVMQVITEKFEEHLRSRQREVLAIMESRRRQHRSYADLPHGIRLRMMDSLADFQQALSERSADVGDEGDEVAANMLGDASMSVETLLALGAPVVDLHHGNFGFKLDAKGQPTTNLVVTDFGLSSLDAGQRQEAYKGATELRTAPKPEKRKKRVEDPRQMKLFENPLIYKVSWKVGQRWSSNAFNSLHEAKQFLERVKQWPGSSFHQVTNTRTGEVVVPVARTVANPELSHKELVALTRCVLGGPEALRMKDYSVDVKTVRALIKKGYFVKGGVCPAGKKLVESLGTKAPLF